jgi:hypothetical protein
MKKSILLVAGLIILAVATTAVAEVKFFCKGYELTEFDKELAALNLEQAGLEARKVFFRVFSGDPIGSGKKYDLVEVKVVTSNGLLEEMGFWNKETPGRSLESVLSMLIRTNKKEKERKEVREKLETDLPLMHRGHLVSIRDCEGPRCIVLVAVGDHRIWVSKGGGRLVFETFGRKGGITGRFASLREALAQIPQKESEPKGGKSGNLPSMK